MSQPSGYEIEQTEVFLENVLDREIKGKDGKKKKISEIIDTERHIWEVNGKIIFKHEAIQRLVHFVGAELLEPKLIVEPSTMNGQAYVFLCSMKFPDGEISQEIGECNQFNAGHSYNGQPSIGQMYPASTAFKRGYDRAFLRSNYMNLFDVFSDLESSAFSKPPESKNNMNVNEIINGYSEMFIVSDNDLPNNMNQNYHQNENINTSEQQPTSNQSANHEIDQLINELNQNNLDNSNKPNENNIETLSEEQIIEVMKRDDSLLRLPETDEKYPNQHIVKDIIKQHQDFEYLNVIKEKYPKNKYYQNIITKLQAANK